MVNKTTVRAIVTAGVLSFGLAPFGMEGWFGQGAQAQSCHGSYQPICITPGGADVDCANGSGNGPRYARGPFYVVGPDQYGLDSDNDGIGCERR